VNQVVSFLPFSVLSYDVQNLNFGTCALKLIEII